MSTRTAASLPAVETDSAPSNAGTDSNNGHAPQSIPPLQAGDFLTRAEFERRYHNHPELKKAELIEGIVYMPSPVNAAYHGNPHFDLIGWLGVYRANVPGLFGSDNATLRLDNINEPQPDILLRLDSEHGGRSQMDEEGYLEGPVEFVVEVAASSASYDMNQKKATYARHGIHEYLVVLTHERRVVWFILRGGVYEPLQPDSDGIFRSETLPGLWFDESAFWRGDLATMIATVEQGMATPEHQAFVEALTNRST